MTAKVLLKRGRANPVWRGHPWIYSGAVAKTEGKCEPGDLVEVCDVEDRLIGTGFINPRSQILIRMLTFGSASNVAEEEVAEHALPAADPLQALIEKRVRAAASLRRRLRLPSEETTTFRLINSEGDHLPGLVIDIYGDVAAVQFSALGMKLREEAVYRALRGLSDEGALVLQAILEVGAGSFSQVEGFAARTRVVWGDEQRLTSGSECRENGVRLRVEFETTQKTGLFLDQRDNRRSLASYCSGCDILDLYSYVGGFSLAALKNGARFATCVDSSARALGRAREHAALNGFAASQMETIEADVFRYLEAAPPYRFDVVVLDPPKFARKERDLPAALKGYQRLNALALNVVRRGGLFATCSCSQLVDEESFERMVAAAASDAGRKVTVLQMTSQGVDHPVPPAFPEGRYLKFMLLAVD